MDSNFAEPNLKMFFNDSMKNFSPQWGNKKKNFCVMLNLVSTDDSRMTFCNIKFDVRKGINCLHLRKTLSR